MAKWITAMNGNSANPFEGNTTVNTRVGKLSFESGYPAAETVAKLYDEIDFQRACQAYIWGIPAVGLNGWRRAHYQEHGGKSGEMLNYFDFTEKLGILTPKNRARYPCIRRLWPVAFSASLQVGLDTQFPTAKQCLRLLPPTPQHRPGE